MYSKSQKFEKQIERIYYLLNYDDAIIKWNDRIVDPDNTNKLRQIDITVRYKDYLTIIECRFQRKIQDVKWIEELYGRKESLNADAVIAVSSSGFTDGAIKKAERFGVILRDTKILTEEEIRRWGRPTKVKLVYYNYENVLLRFMIKSEKDKVLTEETLINAIKKNNIFAAIFEKAAKGIHKEKIPNIPVRITIPFEIKNFIISGFKIRQIVLESDFRKIEKTINTPSIVVFDDPQVPSIERNKSIEKFELDDFEITKSSNNVSVAMDLSKIDNPTNAQFRDVSRPNLSFGLENVMLEVNFER